VTAGSSTGDDVPLGQTKGRDNSAELFDSPAGQTNPAARAITIGRIAPMGLLPCLRRGPDRWWLPLSGEATVALGFSLLSSRHDRKPVDSRTRARLLQAMRCDPPLMIYAALCWPGEQGSLPELADWLLANASGRFASGDAFLGAPQIEASHQQRWNKLRDHYRTLPIDGWLDEAAVWLEVTGPHVPDAWKRQWPKISADDEHGACSRELAGGSMLQQLARLVQRQHSLEQSFDERLHKSKLGALKQLAYGLSHEINNPLANISTRAQQLQRGEKDATREAILQRIVDQVYRAHEMIADLMFYANPPVPTQQDCDLNDVVRRVAQDFEEEVTRQAIRLEVKACREPAIAKVDGTMIGEALRALLRNSIDAIGCEGTIVVSLVPDAMRWLIHVADSGPGLSDVARQHAFDPYFSGREAGRGLGLGLCRAYRIAKLHDGEITLAGGPTGCVATISLNAR
jgi:signal transduction histidine kinase